MHLSNALMWARKHLRSGLWHPCIHVDFLLVSMWISTVGRIGDAHCIVADLALRVKTVCATLLILSSVRHTHCHLSKLMFSHMSPSHEPQSPFTHQPERGLGAIANFVK